jgi:hypothetical protein
MATNPFDLGGLLFDGGDNGLSEYLSDAQRQAIQRQAMLQAAGALLQAGGPSTQRISLGQALGSALQAGSKGYTDAQQNALTQLMTKQKLDEYKRQKAIEERLGNIFTAEAPVAGMPMTPQQALAAPGGQAGPTVERAAMIGQTPEGAAVSPEDMRYEQYMKAAQLFAAEPTKAKAYMDMALAIKPKTEVTGDIFTAKDGTQYQRTKTGQFVPVPTGIEFAQETVGEPFKAADGKFYLRTKTGGFVPAEQGLAAKPMGQPQQVMGADGKPTLVQMYDDGTYKPVTGVSPLIPPEKIDTGGGVRFVNPYEVKPGTVFPKTLAPQVVGGAETGYYVVGGGGGGTPTAPAAQTTTATTPSRRGPPMPGAAASTATAAAGPQPIIPGTGKQPPQDFLTKSYGIQNTNDAVNNFVGVISNFKSSDMVDPTRRAELSSAHSRAMLYAKELFNLGVLTGGDEVILNKVLMNPVDFSTAAVPIDAVRKQAEDLQKVIQSSASNLSKTYKQPALELNKYQPPKAQGITEGAESVSKSGKPIVYRNGAWEYK